MLNKAQDLVTYKSLLTSRYCGNLHPAKKKKKRLSLIQLPMNFINTKVSSQRLKKIKFTQISSSASKTPKQHSQNSGIKGLQDVRSKRYTIRNPRHSTKLMKRASNERSLAIPWLCQPQKPQMKMSNKAWNNWGLNSV